MKFNEECNDDFEKQNSINIQKISQWKLQVHLGFLKLNNTYEIVMDIGPTLENPKAPNNIIWLANVIRNLILPSILILYAKTQIIVKQVYKIPIFS